MVLIDVLKFLLNVIYLPFKLLRVKRKITFISRQSNSTPLELQMIIDSLKNENIKIVTISKKLDMNFKSLVINFFLFFKEMYHIATSKMLIVDGFCILCSNLYHKKSLVILQTWHANGIIKKIGLQTLESRTPKKRQLAIKLNMHKNYNYVLSSSKETSKVYLEAFSIKKDALLEYGTPMLDYLYYGNYRITDDICKRNKKINVIYMPTVRKNTKLDMSELLDNFDFKKYNLYLKLHPAYRDDNIDKRINLITNYSAEQVLTIADYVITDYSNVAFEASLVGVPVLFYIPDIDYYRNDPGLNIDIQKEVSKYATTNMKDLLKMLEEKYDMDYLKNFTKKYINFYDGKCVERIKKFILTKV